MNKLIKTTGTVVLSAAVLFGASACSSTAEAKPDTDSSASSTARPGDRSAKAAVETIEGFFAAATSDEVAADFPDKATGETFAAALDFVDTNAPASELKAAVADLAILKISDPAAKLTIAIDESEVLIDGPRATVPVTAVTISAGETDIDDEGAVAEQINDLVFVDGSWAIAFPEPVTATAKPTADSK